MEDVTEKDVQDARKHKREISDALGTGITIGALGMLAVVIFTAIMDRKEKRARKEREALRNTLETAEAAHELAKDAEKYARDLAEEVARGARKNN